MEKRWNILIFLKNKIINSIKYVLDKLYEG